MVKRADVMHCAQRSDPLSHEVGTGNDRPPQIGVPVSVDTPEDVIVPITDFALTDIDGFITVTLSTPAGVIVPNPVISGDAATVAAELALISYVPNEDFFGPTVIDIQVDDGPHTESNFYIFNVYSYYFDTP